MSILQTTRTNPIGPFRFTFCEFNIYIHVKQTITILERELPMSYATADQYGHLQVVTSEESEKKGINTNV